jgi:lipopolysaccharide export LptBFGC system permease protein LptF
MGMTEFNQIGIVPAFFVVLAGLLALHGQEEDKGRGRIVMLFLGIGLILLLVIFLAAVFSFGEDRGVSIVLMGLLMPAIIGIQAFILLNWKALGDINRKPLVIVLLG